jgi:hypothetical protein
VYIPSAVATVMGFRCGVIGSLKDKQFPVHRYALDQTAILYGAAFWGALFTCALLWALTGTIAFIVVWEVCKLKHIFNTKLFQFNSSLTHGFTRFYINRKPEISFKPSWPPLLDF